MSHEINTKAYEKVKEFLAEHGRNWVDLMENEKGKYFNVGPDEEGKYEKVYLPEQFQEIVI